MTEIDENIAKARKAETNKQWDDALLHYSEALRQLDEKYGIGKSEGRATGISDEADKCKAWDCLISHSYCTAKKAEQGGNWGSALSKYSEVIRRLDEKNGIVYPGDRERMDETDKRTALDCWLCISHCKIEMTRTNPEVALYDMGEEIAREIKKMERELKTYHMRNTVDLWNMLQNAYDRWGDERQRLGRQNEADNLRVYMLRARVKLRFWRLFE
jgi:hypothetical protein